MTLPTITATDLPRLAYAHGPDHDPVFTQPEKFRPVVNTIFGPKPDTGGLWTSPVTREDFATGEILSTDWTDYRRAMNFDMSYYTDFIEITPNQDFQGLLIDTLDDIRTILAKYALPTELGGFIDVWATLDWERMALDQVDAVYLTDRGRQVTYLPDDRSLAMTSWDCSTVLWLTPNYQVI